METPRDLRLAVWSRLFDGLRPRHLQQIAHREIPFERLPDVFEEWTAGKVTGRTVVRIADSD